MFGSQDTPGVRVGTEWTSPDIYLRRSFDLTTVPADVRLRVFHDEDAKIYINGRLVKSLQGYKTSYVTVKMDQTDGVLNVGKNTIAVHCHQNDGGQGIDVGLMEVKDTSGNSIP